MIISFAWTTSAFLASRKRCTRRHWNDDYALRFRQGSIHDAYDKLARCHGKKIGNLRLTRPPFKQFTSCMTEADYEDEGLQWMEEQGLRIRGISPREFFDNWVAANEEVWVIRFDPILVQPSDNSLFPGQQIALPLF